MVAASLIGMGLAVDVFTGMPYKYQSSTVPVYFRLFGTIVDEKKADVRQKDCQLRTSAIHN